MEASQKSAEGGMPVASSRVGPHLTKDRVRASARSLKLHYRWELGDYVNWKYSSPCQPSGAERHIFAKYSVVTSWRAFGDR
jgi:hypothetical protein